MTYLKDESSKSTVGDYTSMKNAGTISMYCTNLTIKELRNNKNNLPKSSLIISSPINPETNTDDTTKTAICMTDGSGNLLVLSRTIQFSSDEAEFSDDSNTIIINKLRKTISDLKTRIKALEK